MLEMGLIRSSANGMFHILPLFQRSLDKCVKLVDTAMHEIEGQKVTLPTLTPSELWKKSGRLHTATTELMTVQDRHEKEFVLSPTHEEAITAMLATISPISYRVLPLRLYQITPKFRDELKPRFGLLRTKEFLMKDLYTFDSTLESAQETYNQVNDTYTRLLNKIGVKFVKVGADTGIMGGSLSHEYHYPAEIGEDSLLSCKSCGKSGNSELFNSQKCNECNSDSWSKTQGIEVAHTFVLDDKYTKPLRATVLQPSGKPMPMIMGCYGIGVTRLIAAAVEVLSSETDIRWPLSLAPFSVCIIPPKAGSKEEAKMRGVEENVCNEIVKVVPSDDVVIDDRTQFTIGKRLMEAKRMGYPFVIILGDKAANDPPQFEIHNLTKDSPPLFLNLSELLQLINESVQ